MHRRRISGSPLVAKPHGVESVAQTARKVYNRHPVNRGLYTGSAIHISSQK